MPFIVPFILLLILLKGNKNKTEGSWPEDIACCTITLPRAQCKFVEKKNKQLFLLVPYPILVVLDDASCLWPKKGCSGAVWTWGSCGWWWTGWGRRWMVRGGAVLGPARAPSDAEDPRVRETPSAQSTLRQLSSVTLLRRATMLLPVTGSGS